MNRLARLLVLLLAALAGACADEGASSDGFRVALLVAGDVTDEGWNQSAHEGLRAIERELDAEVRKVQAATPVDIERQFEFAADQGYDLVFGHGEEFNLPASRVAARFPDTFFVSSGGTRTADNLLSVDVATEDGAYLLGVLAGRLSETGVVSAISGVEMEPTARAVRGFRNGLRSVRPDARLLVDYVDSWEDSVRAKEIALLHIEQGADLLFQNADSAGVGIFEACRARGVKAFGCNRDQSAKAPDVILASAVSDIPQVFLSIAQDLQAGTLAGGVRRYQLADDKVRVVYNPALEGDISDEARRAVDEAAQAVRAGEVDVSGD